MVDSPYYNGHSMNLRICPDCEKTTDAEVCPACGTATLDEAPFRKREDPLIGKLLAGRYRILESLGRGGMGKVFVAEQVTMKRLVALKVIHTHDSGEMSEKMLLFRRFQREAMAASRLEHHNTVRVFDFGMAEEGTLFLAMELLRGSTLTKVMDAGPMPAGRAIHIAVQICKSLAEAHEKGIVHRDLKPDNIMVFDMSGERDFVKVLDFGIAKITASTGESSITRTGVIVGTPAYMAPEQATATGVGPATDLYALGVILYEALTGRQPFTGDTPLAILLKHVNEKVPPLVVDGFPPDVPEDLSKLVLGLLEKSPSRRHASAMDVAGLLEQIDSPGWEGAAFLRPFPEPAVLTGAAPGAAAPTRPRAHAPSRDLAVRREPNQAKRWVMLGLMGVASLSLVLAVAVLWTRDGCRKQDSPIEAQVQPTGVASSEVQDVHDAVDGPDPVPNPAVVIEDTVLDSGLAIDGAETDTIGPTQAPAPALEPDEPDREAPATTIAPTARKVRLAPPKPPLPRCIRSNCPIHGDCEDTAGRRVNGGAFCGDLAL